MELNWHNYSYYPYERELAGREVEALLTGAKITHANGKVVLSGHCDPDQIRRLAYFSGGVTGGTPVYTVQRELERAAAKGASRQATRYSVHGLHEYKGKFNPQVVRALLNILQVEKGGRVLDPFCGSGTTLVECAHMGIIGHGTDLNPLAVYIANAKLRALAACPAELRDNLKRVLRVCREGRAACGRDEHHSYLHNWFEERMLRTIERLRREILDNCGDLGPILLVIASNLLRDYSLQDPNDLRIRRRSSPLPSTPFLTAFEVAAEKAIERIEQTQAVLSELASSSAAAILCDICKRPSGEKLGGRFDAAVTSPPYAMALPYIDTQRLSLVWLRQIAPDEILDIESVLIGSREIRGDRGHLDDALSTNAAKLPAPQYRFCKSLLAALGPGDGFRRQAVPKLLYRYFSGMKNAFRTVRSLLRKDAPFALIIGHNHTTLGGTRFDIDTPAHLASLARSEGWKLEERLALQTYQRYGYHMSNAVRAETLMILRNA